MDSFHQDKPIYEGYHTLGQGELALLFFSLNRYSKPPDPKKQHKMEQ